MLSERGDKMSEYKQGYFILFSACADAEEEIEKQNYGKAREILISAMQRAEESYIEYDEKNNN